ncbi:MAG: hypothetical protein RLZZ213_1044, partial [Cyanobacteriota bacterium]
MPVARFSLVSLLASALVLTGAAPGQLRAQQANPQVRVLLLETAKLTLAAPQQPLVLRAGSQRWSLAPLESVVLQLAAGSLVLERAAGAEQLPAVRELWLEPAAQSAGAPLNLQFSPQEGADFQLEQRGYRGRLQVLVGSSSLQAINHVPLEAYLPSVVASEMPASWPQAALRAQAVAARTYALRQRKPAAAFDVSATVSSQVYKGVEAET